MRLLVPQRGDRINAGGPPGGNVARQERNRGQQHRNCGKGRRVRWSRSVEEPGYKARQTKSPREADRCAGQGQPDAAPDKDSDHFDFPGAKRHSNPDLMRPPAHRIRDDSVHPGCSQEESYRGKRAEQRGVESRIAGLLRYDLVHVFNAVDRQIFVDGLYGSPQVRDARAGIRLRPDDEAHCRQLPGPGHLKVALVKRTRRFRIDYILSSASHDPHDLAQSLTVESYIDPFAQTVLARPDLLSEAVADDDYARPSISVPIVEVAPLQQLNPHCAKVAGGNCKLAGEPPG